MKKGRLIEKCALGAFVCLFLFEALSFQSGCGEIRENVIRMHVVANSDSEADQRLKLIVRDEILREGEALLQNTQEKEEALAALSENLSRFERTAKETLRENGCFLPVSVSLETAYFPTKEYETVTLPAGTYDALRVVIGAGEGKNFWCVLFPSLCLGASFDERDFFCRIGENGAKIVSGAQEYAIEWKVLEIIEKIRSFFDQGKDE